MIIGNRTNGILSQAKDAERLSTQQKTNQYADFCNILIKVTKPT